MGHEISDRYYKLGSSLDMTCQVALSFLNTLSSPTKYSHNRITTTVLQFINTNQIKKNIGSENLNIKWKKDGKELPKNIKISLRSVKKHCYTQICVYFSFVLYHHLNSCIKFYSFLFAFLLLCMSFMSTVRHIFGKIAV